MGIDFEIGLGLELDEELVGKIIEKLEIDNEDDEDLIELISDELYCLNFNNNPIGVFTTGDFMCDYNIKHWIGINLDGYSLLELERLLLDKNSIINWFSEFGLDIKFEDLVFIKKIKIH